MIAVGSVIDKVADFIQANKCERGGDYDISTDPMKSVTFRTTYENKTNLVKSLGNIEGVKNEFPIVTVVEKETSSILVEAGMNPTGFYITINERMLVHPRYGKVVSEVWRRIWNHRNTEQDS